MANRAVNNLSWVWWFWNTYKWYLIILLLFVLAIAFYQRNPLASTSGVALIVFVILAFLLIMIFNDRNNASVYFALDPLPPHLGLDGVSNDVRNSN